MSKGTRVRNTINGKVGVIIQHVGLARWEVEYDNCGDTAFVLDVFLETVE